MVSVNHLTQKYTDIKQARIILKVFLKLLYNQSSYLNFITILLKTMNNKKIDVTGIGNAIVDVIANVNDEFLARHSLHKGTMCLIEEHDALKLKSGINAVRVVSGGSAANTIAGLSVLGNKTAFIGKIKDDDFGNAFEQELKKLGVLFNTTKAGGVDAPSTATCIVLTTPDAQRTMNTCLGIANLLQCIFLWIALHLALSGFHLHLLLAL